VPSGIAALDALLFTRDPFPVQTVASWWNYGADKNTRVMIFASNLFLNPGETASAVVIHLVDANNQSFDVAAEDVRAIRDTEIAQVTFRLPNNIAAGTCSVTVKAHNTTSNIGTIRIAP